MSSASSNKNNINKNNNKTKHNYDDGGDDGDNDVTMAITLSTFVQRHAEVQKTHVIDNIAHFRSRINIDINNKIALLKDK